MDSMVFSLRLTGVILQILGGIVGVYWLIARLLDYPPLVSAASWLAAGAPQPQEMILNRKVLRDYIRGMAKTYREYDDRYSIFNPIAILGLVVTEIFLIGATWGWIALLTLIISGKTRISVDTVGLVLISGCFLLFDLVLALARVKFARDIGVRDVGSKKAFTTGFVKEFLSLFSSEPIQGITIIMILALLLLLNWFAWTTRILPRKYHIDLNRKKTRQFYYTAYASFTFLIGSCMLLASMLIEH